MDGGQDQPSTSASSSSRGDADGSLHVKQCHHCRTTNTPVWRRDPVTNNTLCNACGVYLQQRKFMRPKDLIDPYRDEDERAGVAPEGPQCSNCYTRTTSAWRRNKDGDCLCNACGVYARLNGKPRPLSLRRNTIRPRSRHPTAS
ncbi:hypothetical protein C8J57DRAFT_1430302 [Mycena rebaudengoi]|nr:hypothetical protein C8J57DRAFT_1598916 [Mycena rebaudengoi]KAJ7289830.1 hypothetical protein C8J57DRAFT_1430302 [Mycena rebaudengoi]